MTLDEDGNYEEGEILEEGEEPEDVVTGAPDPVAAAAAPHRMSALPRGPSPSACTTTPMDGRAPSPSPVSFPPVIRAGQPPLGPRPQALPSTVPPASSTTRSYHRSDLNDSTAHNRKRVYSEMRQSDTNGRSSSTGRYSSSGYPSGRQPPTPSSSREPRGGGRNHDDRTYFYNPDLITLYPRQVPTSQILLNFETWMELAAGRSRRRVDIDDLQDLILKTVDTESIVSPFLLPGLFPGASPPSKVCVVLLGSLHPAVLQRYRRELPFFNACTVMPCVLSKAEAVKRVENPLPELLFRFAKPPVDTKEMPQEELFYGHELTFLMCHSAGYNDELILQPSGRFSRKAQARGGTWELDGDLLHLKWRQHHKTADESNASIEDDDYILDVLVAEDETMHYFSTDAMTDKIYARDAPDHLSRRRDGKERPRSIRLSLVKATPAEVPRAPDGTLIRMDKSTSVEGPNPSSDPDESEVTDSLTIESFEPYVLSLEELRQHDYPLDIVSEQVALDSDTGGNNRDRYVKTQPRSPSSSTKEESLLPNVYALDCEMCETDLGHELTRITVVNVHGVVVYDEFVKPQSTIINYNTEFSGITAESLKTTRHILADVQRELLERFLFEDTILVGHSLTSDLRALRLVHTRIADTAILYPHQRGFPFKTSLKFLTKTFLGKDIQTKIQEGHDSAEDAVAAMELLIQKVRRGPMFGIPEPTFLSGAYETLLEKIATREKKVSLIRCEAQDPHQGGAVANADIASKPWHLFASGDLQTFQNSPLQHASTLLNQDSSINEENSKNVLTTVVCTPDFDAAKHHVVLSLRGPDSLCWVEINQSTSPAVANEFLYRHDEWMDRQLAHCKKVDAFLCGLREQSCQSPSEGRTLVVVVPQGDLSMLRYLRGLRTQAKWKDGPRCTEWTDDMHAAVSDAFRGTMDSSVFLMQM